MIENQHFPKMEAFVKQAEELVKSDPDAEQAVVMWTERGNRFHLVNHDIISGNTYEESAFIKTLTEHGDTKIRYVVCMWKDLTIDMISHHLLESLIRLDSANKETEIILKTAEGLRTKSFAVCLP